MFMYITYILEHISWCNLSVAYAVIVNISFAQFYLFCLNAQSNMKFTVMWLLIFYCFVIYIQQSARFMEMILI